ncbi:MAG: helix-turn-helix transcriptional regulator [Nostocoides sp.]
MTGDSRRSGAAAPEAATSRLARLLTEIPWLSSRPGISVQEASAGLGISPEQLRSDLDLIFLCGYGQMPDELIEVESDGDHIVIGNADTVRRPLRLGLDEAITLMVGLRALGDVPGLTDSVAVAGALAKLEEATGAVGEATRRVHVDIADDSSATAMATIRVAIDHHRRLHLRYLVPSRDETTARDVDPMRLASLDGHWYLEGWCHRSEAVRLFRLDRIESIQQLDVDGTPPAHAAPRNLDAGTFEPGESDESVTLTLSRRGRWVADYYPVEQSREDADGSLTVVLRVGDRAWLRRLVLGLGGAGRIVAPADLAAEVEQEAAEALAAYDAT